MQFLHVINQHIGTAFSRIRALANFRFITLLSWLKLLLKKTIYALERLQERHIALNLKHFFGIFCFLFIFFWLNNILLGFFNTIIIANTFDKLDICPFGYGLGSLYLLLASIIAAHCVINYRPGKFKPTAIIIFILLFTSTLYCLERYFNWHYNFQMLFYNDNIWGKIAVLDIVFFSFFCFGIGYVLAEILTPLSNYKNSFINTDTPLDDLTDDEFERKLFVDKMANWLNGLRLSTDKSFVIGFNGSWGFGKTSLIQMIFNEIRSDVVKIEFNPWIATKDFNLIRDFFNTLNEEISKHITTANIFQSYGKKLTSLEYDKNPLKPFSDFFEEEPLKESFKRITDLLKSLQKSVFILIDDIDRLNKDEVYEILRLVRNTASFPNLTFVIAYDRQYIEAALKANLIPDYDKYLEKIIQLEIKIPAISEHVLKNSFIKEIRRQIILTPLSYDDKQEAMTIADNMIFGNPLAPNNLKYEFNKNLSKFVRNKRDIIRFTNAFVMRLSFYYDQVYIPDLFLVEFIRTFLPKLHERISFQNNNYIYKNKLNSSIEILDLEKDPDDSYQSLQPEPTLKKFIDDTYNNHSYINEIKSLVEALISEPVGTEANNDYGIYYRDYYDSYFTLVIPTNVVNLAAVTRLIQTPETV